MRRFLYSLVFTHCFILTKAQENLILNPSFEKMKWCHEVLPYEPAKIACYTYPLNSTLGNLNEKINLTYNTWFSPLKQSTLSFTLYWYKNNEYFFINLPVSNLYTFTNGHANIKPYLYQPLYTASCYLRYFSRANSIDRNFAKGTLTKVLQKGCEYSFKTKFRNFSYPDDISNPISTSSFGVSFTDDTSHYDNYKDLIAKLQPDISNPKDSFIDNEEYKEFIGTFTAKGGERYLVLGNFDTDENTRLKYKDSSFIQLSNVFSYYTIDDLSLTAIPPANLKLNLGKDTITCGKNQPLKLVAQQGFDGYTWNTGDTGRVLNITKAGIYIVKADFGCGVLSDTILVKAYAYKKNQLQIGELLQKCPDEQISLKAANGYSNYTWSNGQNGAELSTAKEGIYTLQATSPEGCIVKDTVQVQNITAPQKVYLGKDTVICQGKSIILDAGTQNAVIFAWNIGDASQRIEAKLAGNYSVAVSNKCFQVSDTISISTIDCSPIFIPNVFTPNGDSNNDTFKIRTEDNRTVTLDIYNRWGERLYHHASYQNQWNADGIPDGMYFYQIVDSEYNKTEKGWVQVLR